MSSLPTRSRALTGAREEPCGRALSPSKNWQTSVRRFGRSSDNKSTYETRSPSLQAERGDLEQRPSIFINCPFDPEFLPFLRAILFTVFAMGCELRSALCILSHRGFNVTGPVCVSPRAPVLRGPCPDRLDERAKRKVSLE